MSEVYESDAGGLQVLHIIATYDQPATASEISQWLDVDTDYVRQTLKKLYRSGYVTREKRDTGGFGPNPYEYEVYEPENQ